jgi:hypothetical protein
MDGIIKWVTDNWLAVAVALSISLKAFRDAFDKTPATDDNLFERIVSIVVKAVASLTTGKRPQA